jgi:archaemetzincin
MDILLVAIGEVDPKLIETLKFDLTRVFHTKIWIGDGMSPPDEAFNKKRRQYFSTAILKTMFQKKEYAPYEKTLGIIDHDLYVPRLNFVFGEGRQRVAIISLTRLRHQFYGLPEDRSLLRKRILTEAVHELGHSCGLRHCGSHQCVMFSSNSLIDTDIKGPAFCPRCKSKLADEKGA